MTNPSYLHGWRCTCPHDRRVYKTNRIAAQRGQSRMVSTIGTTRRIQALYVMGYSAPEIAMRTGLGIETIRRHGRGEQQEVYIYVHDRVREVYAEIENTRGPSIHNAGRALRKGWHPPAAWDDIDDPKERPKR